MNKFLKKVGSKVAAVGAFATAAAGAAQAALPTEVATTIATAKTDVNEAGGLIIGVVVAIATFAWLRRVIK